MATRRRWVVVGIILLAVGAGALALLFSSSNDTPISPEANVSDTAVPEASPETSTQTSDTTMAEAPAATTASTPETGTKAHPGNGRVFGKVTLPDSAPQGLRVSVELRDAGEMMGLSADPASRITANAGADGSYEVTNLTLNSYAVVATAPGYIGVGTAMLTPKEPSDTVDVRLHPAATISGRVVNASGGPVSGAAVVVNGETREGNYSYTDDDAMFPLRVKSMADGSFTLTMPVRQNTRPRYKLLARAEGFAPAITDYVAAGASDVSIVLKPGHAVSGMLVEAETGKPLPDKQVALDNALSAMDEPAQTDADGFFFLTDVPPGQQRVRVIDEELVAIPDSAAFTVTEGVPTDEVIVRAAKGGRITGRVYDTDSGQGIAGASVSAWVSNERIDASRGATTDANGVYTITGLAAEAYNVSSERPEGYGQNYRDSFQQRMVVASLGGEVGGVDFAMKRGLRITGRVQDESGNPIAGAYVHGDQLTARAYDNADSGVDGTFTLSGFEQDKPVEIEATKDGHALARVEPGREVSVGTADVTGVVVVLGPEGTISGIVVDAQGRPKADVSMTASGADDETYEWATSGPDGSILFEGLAAGEYELTFSSDSPITISSNSGAANRSDTQTVRVKKGERVSGLRFVAPEAGALSIAGRIEDSRGRPVSDAQVMAYGAMMDFSNATSNSKGEFNLHGLGKGRFTLNVTHEEYSDATNVVASSGTADLRIVLKDLATIEGQVLNAATGAPIKAFRVSPQRKMDMLGMAMMMPDIDGRMIHDPDGRFTLKDIEDGVAELLVTAEGFAETKQAIPAVSGGETRSGIVVRMSAGASLIGRVTDAAGKPVAGAQVSLAQTSIFDFDLDDSGDATTRGDGTYRLTSLTPGTVKISVDHQDYPATTATATVVAGGEARLDVVMNTGGIVEGRVTLDGKPVPDQAVQVYGADIATFNFDGDGHKTDANGRYRVAGIGVGSAYVSVDIAHEGFTRSRSETVQIKDGMVTQLDFNLVSGTSAIEGTIFEREGVPVSESFSLDVRVYDSRESFSAQSDESGHYIIEGLPAGNAVISIDRDMSMKTVMVEVPPNERVRKDILLSGGATVRVTIVETGGPSMMTPVFLMAGETDLSQLSMDELENGGMQPAAVAMATGGEAVLEGIEPGKYTLWAMKFDPTNIEAMENPFASSNSVSKVIEVKKDQQLEVELEL